MLDYARDWKTAFDSATLEEGYDLYEDGALTSLNRIGSFITGRIEEDGREWDISCDLDYFGMPSRVRCSCGRESWPCRHIAALLYGAEETGEGDVEEILKALENVRWKDIKLFLLDMADHSEAFSSLLSKWASAVADSRSIPERMEDLVRATERDKIADAVEDFTYEYGFRLTRPFGLPGPEGPYLETFAAMGEALSFLEPLPSPEETEALLDRYVNTLFSLKESCCRYLLTEAYGNGGSGLCSYVLGCFQRLPWKIPSLKRIQDFLDSRISTSRDRREKTRLSQCRADINRRLSALDPDKVLSGALKYLEEGKTNEFVSIIDKALDASGDSDEGRILADKKIQSLRGIKGYEGDALMDYMERYGIAISLIGRLADVTEGEGTWPEYREKIQKRLKPDDELRFIAWDGDLEMLKDLLYERDDLALTLDYVYYFKPDYEEDAADLCISLAKEALRTAKDKKRYKEISDFLLSSGRELPSCRGKFIDAIKEIQRDYPRSKALQAVLEDALYFLT